jgi:hypothetical protein
MVRVWSIFTLLLVCFVAASTVRADDAPKKHKGPTPEARFDALEKAANHDPLKGELTKDEFIAAFKATTPDKADKASGIYKAIPKADMGKVTKDEWVKFAKEHVGKGKKKDA